MNAVLCSKDVKEYIVRSVFIGMIDDHFKLDVSGGFVLAFERGDFGGGGGRVIGDFDEGVDVVGGVHGCGFDFVKIIKSNIVWWLKFIDSIAYRVLLLRSSTTRIFDEVAIWFQFICILDHQQPAVEENSLLRCDLLSTLILTPKLK